MSYLGTKKHKFYGADKEINAVGALLTESTILS